jgi:Tol biopolymer transport system component
VINADGTGVRRVTAGFDLSVAWAPDGSQIAFQKRSGLYVENADGTDRRRIVRCDCAQAAQLAWSPDGRFIAYVEWTDDDLEASTLIHLVHPDGTGDRVLAEGGQGGPPELSWSPDGEQIVFTRPPDVTERPGIYVIGRDGGRERRIGSGEAPVWSTAGTRIAFATPVGEVFAINSDGSRRAQARPGRTPLVVADRDRDRGRLRRRGGGGHLGMERRWQRGPSDLAAGRRLRVRLAHVAP